MEPMRVLPLSVVLVAVLAAAGTDLRSFRIRNALTVPLFLSGLLFHFVSDGSSGLAESVLGVLIGTLPFAWLYAAGGMGAGDLKLLAGVGAWLGPWAVLHVLIVSGLATGCCALGLMFWRWHNSTASPNHSAQRRDVSDVLSQPDRRRRAIPFGVMVAVGVIVTAFWVK